MSDETPAGVPSSGNGQYIALAVVFLLLGGGFLIFKLKGNDRPPPPTVPTSTASMTAARPTLTDAPPPPPLPEEDAGAPTADAGTKVATGGGGPCSTTCSGSASPGLQSEVSAIAGRARGCYERALRQNAQLQGRMTVALKVDSAGNVCGASPANDTLGSPEVSSCVTGMFRGKKFSPPTGGCVNISIPLNFAPKK